MRIISGKFKARRLSPPKNITARPTTDFAKESLFNLLNNRMELEDIMVLDLFAGTGGISFECVSRGAAEVVAVELAQRQADFIRKTIAELKITNMTLIRGDVFKYVGSMVRQFDFIYADPPYDLPALPKVPDLIFERQLLKPGGLFIMEHSAKNDFSEHPNFVEHRKYGSVNFSFFELPEA